MFIVVKRRREQSIIFTIDKTLENDDIKNVPRHVGKFREAAITNSNISLSYQRIDILANYKVLLFRFTSYAMQREKSQAKSA